MYSEKLTKALIDFFYSTTVSSAIIESLDERKESLNKDEILSRVRDIRRLELPETAIESSLTILEESGLITISAGNYELTQIGKDLAIILTQLRSCPG